jgi:hypothetical protein
MFIPFPFFLAPFTSSFLPFLAEGTTGAVYSFSSVISFFTSCSEIPLIRSPDVFGLVSVETTSLLLPSADLASYYLNH